MNKKKYRQYTVYNNNMKKKIQIYNFLVNTRI